MEKENKKKLIAHYKEQKETGGVYCICNEKSGEKHIFSTPNLAGAYNRFQFAQKTGSCAVYALQAEWQQTGGAYFSYSVLDSLEKKETQTRKEFLEDLKALEELWLEKQL